MKKILSQAVVEAQFDIQPLMKMLRASGVGEGPTWCNADTLRGIMNAFGKNDSRLVVIRRPYSIRVPPETFKALTDSFRLNLKRHVRGDHIGIGLPVFLAGGSISPCPIDQFAMDCVRASVFLGVERVAKLLNDWEIGTPIDHQRKTVLSGVDIDEIVRFDIDNSGRIVKFGKLPKSSQEIEQILPDFLLHFHVSTGNLMGAVIMTMTLGAKSSIFRKKEQTSDGWDIVGPNQSPDYLTDALSLACGTKIDWIASWSESDLFRYFGGISALSSVMKNFVPGGNEAKLTKSDLEKTREIMSRWKSFKSNEMMRLAAQRLAKSIGGGNISDQFIDLRVALDMTFLGDAGQGEMGFRLATHAAWLLGANPQERLCYQETMKKVYNLASRVLHGNTIKFKDEDRKLLQDGQKICRAGILKIIENGKIPDWKNLILGGRESTSLTMFPNVYNPADSAKVHPDACRYPRR